MDISKKEKKLIRAAIVSSSHSYMREISAELQKKAAAFSFSGENAINKNVKNITFFVREYQPVDTECFRFVFFCSFEYQQKYYCLQELLSVAIAPIAEYFYRKLTLPTDKSGGFSAQPPQPAHARSYTMSPSV